MKLPLGALNVSISLMLLLSACSASPAGSPVSNQLPTSTPSSASTPNPTLTPLVNTSTPEVVKDAEYFGAHLDEVKAQIPAAVSVGYFEGGNGVPAGIYSYDQHGNANGVYNKATGEFDVFDKKLFNIGLTQLSAE